MLIAFKFKCTNSVQALESVLYLMSMKNPMVGFLTFNTASQLKRKQKS